MREAMSYIFENIERNNFNFRVQRKLNIVSAISIGALVGLYYIQQKEIKALRLKVNELTAEE